MGVYSALSKTGKAAMTKFAFLAACALAMAALFPHHASAADAPDERWSLHGQVTLVEQYHPPFAAPYRGANSLDAGSRGNETVDATLFAGVTLWDGGEAYADPEIDQGFGLSDTLGVAGFPSGEAYKVGKSAPYIRLQRLFFRQTFDLCGEIDTVESGANQLAASRTADNVIVTAGKFSVTDIFDTNAFAHDPKSDFLNWALIDAGAFDYAADTWGYSYGAALEWNQDWWTLRAGLFDLSRVPNTTELQRDFSQFEAVTELEARHRFWEQEGRIKLLGFLNRGRMGSYADANRLAAATGRSPDTALVRKYASRPGGAINVEQPISDTLGAFARFSLNDGSKEAYEFTEINRSLAAGIALKGSGWGRPDDVVGFAGVANTISRSAQSYFAEGGLGILIGDGQLPHYANETIVETYYSAAVSQQLAVSADYQLIANPAYSRDRGPVSVLGLRLHTQF
jgi:high affinity Mn2+ porin